MLTVQSRFLLAQLYMDALEDKQTSNEVRDVLEGLTHRSDTSDERPEQVTLYAAYDAVISRINAQRHGFRNRAMEILSWITNAMRPLSKDELKHALAVRVGKDNLDEGNVVANLDVSICAGLVIIDSLNHEIRLAHYTTQEYLKDRHFKPPINTNPHDKITDVCVTYMMMYSVFRNGPCGHKDTYTDRITSFPLYLYCAEYWARHARLCSKPSEFLLKFLQSHEATGAAAQADVIGLKNLQYRNWDRSGKEFRKLRLAFHLVVSHGLHSVAEALPTRSEDLDALYEGKTPLYTSLDKGDMKMAQILRRKGAKVQVAGGFSTLDLFRHHRTPDILLNVLEEWPELGAALDNVMGDCRVMTNAVDSGAEKLVSLMLQRADKIGSLVFKNAEYLRSAVQGGHARIAMSLWKHGADPNKRVGGKRFSAFHEAVRCGYIHLVETLLEKEHCVELTGAESTSPDFSSVDLLDQGSESAKHDWDKECGAVFAPIAVDIETRDADGHTPFATAAKLGHHRIAELLLRRGAHTEAKNDEGETPLWLAIEGQNAHMVELLLENSAHISTANKTYHALLSIALSPGHCRIFELLLGRSPPIETQDDRNALLWLAILGQKNHTIELLLKHGANIDALDKSGHTMLATAAKSGHHRIAKLLLGYGANIEAQNDDKQTPLWLAVNGHDYQITELLLQNGANINIADKYGRTPLLSAVEGKDTQLVKLLLQNGADIDISEQGGRTPLIEAVRRGYGHLVELLLENGADVNIFHAYHQYAS